MNVYVSEHPDIEGGKALSGFLSEHHGEAILLLLSGGSAFNLLNYVDGSVIGKSVTLGVLDERFSSDPKVNNFLQLSQTKFFINAVTRSASTIDTSVQDGESMEACALRFENTLRAWVRDNPQGYIVATLGIGEDGHTAGIMPNTAIVSQDTSRWVVSYTAPPEANQYRERVTTTYTFLREHVAHAFVYVVGESKKDALRRIIAESGNLTTTPARILREMRVVELYTTISCS